MGRLVTRVRIIPALLAGGLLVAGCGRDAAPPQQAGPEAASTAAAIAAEEDQWNRDYVARNLEGLVARYAPDAVMKQPGVPPLTGRWIRKAYEAAVADPAFALTFAHDRIEVSRSGDLAYSRGHYELSQTDIRSGQPMTQYGTYLTVWRKAPHGRWQVLEDFITPGPRPRPPM